MSETRGELTKEQTRWALAAAALFLAAVGLGIPAVLSPGCATEEVHRIQPVSLNGTANLLGRVDFTEETARIGSGVVVVLTVENIGLGSGSFDVAALGAAFLSLRGDAATDAVRRADPLGEGAVTLHPGMRIVHEIDLEESFPGLGPGLLEVHWLVDGLVSESASIVLESRGTP